jgi:hypothetical protein
LLQGTIPDFSACRVCNIQRINILTGAGKWSTLGEVIGKLTLPARTELIVQLQVSAGSRIGEGLVERAEIASGIYLAESLVKSK